MAVDCVSHEYSFATSSDTRLVRFVLQAVGSASARNRCCLLLCAPRHHLDPQTDNRTYPNSTRKPAQKKEKKIKVMRSHGKMLSTKGIPKKVVKQ